MEKKHLCPDCKACQWCADDRCRLCLRSGSCRKKLSFAEQIALYERINARPAGETIPTPVCAEPDVSATQPSPSPK